MPRPTVFTASASLVRCARPLVPDSEKLTKQPLDLALRTAEPYLTPAIRAEARAEFAPYLGQPQTSPLLVNRMIDFLAERCLPTYPLDEARRWLGAQALSLYVKTLSVQAIYFVLRWASIEQILRGLPRQFATSQNYGTYEMEEIAPRHWRFTLQDYPIYPSIVQGYCEAGARLLQNDTRYVYTIINSHHCYFDITWEIGRLSDERREYRVP